MDEFLDQYPVEDKDAEEATEIEWSAGIEAHLATHGVSQDEVEQVFANPHVWKANKNNRVGQSIVYGRAKSGRPLVIVVVITDDDRIRPITGWDMSPSLQRLYLR